MRGSIYYQTAVLTKLVFEIGAKKVKRKDKTHDSYNRVASFNTMDAYRKIWNDFGSFTLDVFNIKDFEKVEEIHVENYMNTKVLQSVSHQYLQKISAAICKLEMALNKFAITYNRNTFYDFSIRKAIVKNAKSNFLTTQNYRDRAYNNPEQIINLLNDVKFILAAQIQLEGGCRAEGISLIKKEQLIRVDTDNIADEVCGMIRTKEKGGKIGEVKISPSIYFQLEEIIKKEGVFDINYRKYTNAIKNACRISNQKCEGTHGFRWNFAQRRIIEYQDAGYSHDESLQMISYEMKHERPDITTHYTG